MSFPIKPLGQVLQQADLISTTQIEIALQEQTQAENIRIGQILALRGWLKQETADFFAEQWPTLLSQESKQPLGHYLKEAGLLNEHQIKTILYEQREMGLRFGELAVLKGWIKPTTISFFLQYLTSEGQLYQSSLGQEEVIDGNSSQILAESPNSELAVQQESNIKESNSNHKFVSSLSWIHQDITHLRPFIRSTIKLFKLDRKASCPEIVLQKVLSWTGAQPFLTQKLCQLICDSETFIPAGEEAARVEQLVQTRLIENWETQVAAEHLLAIRKGIVENQHCDPMLLLRLYQQVLLETEVPTHHNPVQTELLDLGLVVKQENKLRVANRIYQSVFNLGWVEQELERLRPFLNNIIKLFKLDQKASRPDILLEQVLSWTGGQPFLTQKLCQLVCDSETFIPAGEETTKVEQLVQTRLIENWEHQAAAEHLRAIQQGLIKNQYCDSIWLLRLYQQILQQGEVSIHDNSPVQTELLNLGLVVQQEKKLRVANRIYQSVFNPGWVEQELVRLQPFIQNTIKLFKLDEKACFPETLLQEVLSWTGGQPFLTQKLCQLICDSETFIPAGEEAVRVEQLVRTRLLENWENQAAAEHLQAIRQALVENRHCKPMWLLSLYQQILQQGEVSIQDSPIQTELLNLGLVVKQENKLRISNRIYQSVFNLDWVEQELAKWLQVSSSTITIPKSVSIKATPTITLFEVNNLIANHRDVIFKSIWILLAIAGLSVFSLNIFRNQQVKNLFQQGNELFHQGEYKKAIAKFDQLLNIDSNYYQAWTNRGYALAGLQEYNKMLESCSTATIIEPKAVYAWNCQGEALHNLKQNYEAISAFDKAIALDSQDPVFWINKTESLIALKQSDTALITIDEAINLLLQKIHKAEKVDEQQQTIRELSVSFSHKGKVLAQKQQYKEALAAYDQALIYDPGYFTAQRGRGLALQSLQQYKEAIAQFQQMLKEHRLTDAQKAETWYYMGLTFCKSSQIQEGFAALEAALKLKPDYQAAEEAKTNCSR
jgi:tetratricopeptide (TPR) repeat protein